MDVDRLHVYKHTCTVLGTTLSGGEWSWQPASRGSGAGSVSHPLPATAAPPVPLLQAVGQETEAGLHSL